MYTPEQILVRLRDRFERDYPGWARGQGSWPLRIGLRPPSTAERSADPVACHEWANSWKTYAGPGSIEHTVSKFPTGTHAMPKTLILSTPREVAAATPKTAAAWQRCGQRLVHLQGHFPHAQLSALIRRITELAEADYQRLVSAATWLHSNPASGMLLRQLPIEGLDTKWLARHARLVLALLGTDDPGTDTSESGTSARLRLHQRLGLRVPPELIQVAVLDPELRQHVGGMRHFAASIDDLNRWPRQPTTVVILENKETGYALTTDHPGAVILHGQGFSVAAYARITWVRAAQDVIYWGDIDLPGLHFVNDLRAHGINARTILTDTETLHRFERLAVTGATTGRSALPHLTPVEQALYRELGDRAGAGSGVLLEQERIPWNVAEQVLVDEIGDRSRTPLN